MVLQNNRNIKETKIEKEYWDIIMAHIKIGAIIIMFFVPLFKELGINNKDIKDNFKELIEAYTGERLYNSEKVDRKN